MSNRCMDISCTVSVALLDKYVLIIITDNNREEPENDQIRRTSLRTHTPFQRETHTPFQRETNQ